MVCILVGTGAVDGQIYHFPAVSMATPGSSSCPPDNHTAAVKSQLSDKLSDVLAKNMKFSCGGSGWRRVAFLNLMDPDQTCPDAWRLYEQDSVRACGRQPSGTASCDSIYFSSDLYAYSHVCGRVTGYQYASPDASRHVAYSPTPGNEINEPYLDGVSITHGVSRQHIWSFYGEVIPHGCCSQGHIDNTASLGFIGRDNFCDTGNPNNDPWGYTLYTEHPLWDGTAQCSDSATCCASHAGPWFYASLLLPSMDDIEVRICGDQRTGDEDTPVGLVEIYIK